MSSYLERRMQPGEVLEYRGRPSWIFALKRAVVWLIISVIGFAGFNATAPNPDVDPNASPSGAAITFAFVMLIAFVCCIVSTIRGVIFVKNSEYLVTDRRTVAKYGFARTKSVDVMMTNIAGVTVNQGAFARLCRYGTIWVEGSGSRDKLVGIANPIGFQHAVYARLEKSRLLMGTAAYTLDVRMAPTPSATQLTIPTPPPAPVQSPPTTPAGWYQDTPESMRYWDGNSWTASTQPAPPPSGPSA